MILFVLQSRQRKNKKQAEIRNKKRFLSTKTQIKIEKKEGVDF